jgi:hypothetical protein
MVSPAGVVQGEDATPSCLHSTVRLYSSTNIMRDSNVGNSGSYTNLRLTLLTGSRQRGSPFCQHTFSDTPRGSASLAPAVVANPNMSIGLYRGSDLNPTQSPVNPAHMVSPAGVVQGGSATPSCLHSTVRLYSSTNIMRDCNVGNSGSHTNLRSTLLTGSRQRGSPFCQHTFSDTPRGCASLAPAVAANPKWR